MPSHVSRPGQTDNSKKRGAERARLPSAGCEEVRDEPVRNATYRTGSTRITHPAAGRRGDFEATASCCYQFWVRTGFARGEGSNLSWPVRRGAARTAKS